MTNEKKLKKMTHVLFYDDLKKELSKQGYTKEEISEIYKRTMMYKRSKKILSEEEKSKKQQKPTMENMIALERITGRMEYLIKQELESAFKKKISKKEISNIMHNACSYFLIKNGYKVSLPKNRKEK